MVLTSISTLENHRKAGVGKVPEAVFSIYLTFPIQSLQKQEPKQPVLALAVCHVIENFCRKTSIVLA